MCTVNMVFSQQSVQQLNPPSSCEQDIVLYCIVLYCIVLVHTCLIFGWACPARAWPDASVRSIMGWWPMISASSLWCFLCRDCAWCRFCPSFSDTARGRCSLIHCCCASSSNTNLRNRSNSSSAALRLSASSRSALILQSFKITACIKNTVTQPNQVTTV